MCKKYLILDEGLLPPCFSGVAHAKQLIADGKAKGVSEAVSMAGISRSTFYKYRDMIEDVKPINTHRLTMLSVTIRNEIEALASLLGLVSQCGFNFWTISSEPPVDSKSKLVIILESRADASDLSTLIDAVKANDYVSDVSLHGIE